jgi:hypothetical protein
VYYDEHIAALRAAKAEVWREAATQLDTITPTLDVSKIFKQALALSAQFDARAAQIEEGE